MLLALLTTLTIQGTPPVSITPPNLTTIQISDHRNYNRNPCRYRQVLVEFVARGKDWGDVWINNRKIFEPRNVNRQQTFAFCPGGYRLVITGMTKYDVWASGYLDLGTSNVVRVAFSKNSIEQVDGDPNAWLPDEEKDKDFWRQPTYW
jgi:hypothetical protein